MTTQKDKLAYAAAALILLAAVLALVFSNNNPQPKTILNSTDEEVATSSMSTTTLKTGEQVIVPSGTKVERVDNNSVGTSTNRIFMQVPGLPNSTYTGSVVGLALKINNLSVKLKTNPENLDGWIELGILKSQAGDYQGARFALEYASSLNLSNTKSFALLGDLYYYKFKMYDTAEGNWRKAILNDPKNPKPYLGLATLYFNFEAKDLKAQSLIVLNDGLKVLPEDPDLLMAKAVYYQKTGNTSEAVATSKLALAAAEKNHRGDIADAARLIINAK